MEENIAELYEINRALGEENMRLKARIAELTQEDPSWFDATPAHAFEMLAKERQRIETMANCMRFQPGFGWEMCFFIEHDGDEMTGDDLRAWIDEYNENS